MSYLQSRPVVTSNGYTGIGARVEREEHLDLVIYTMSTISQSTAGRTEASVTEVSSKQW